MTQTDIDMPPAAVRAMVCDNECENEFTVTILTPSVFHLTNHDGFDRSS